MMVATSAASVGIFGATAAEGFAVGRAMRLARAEHVPGSSVRPLALREAIVRVRQDLAHLLAALPPDEAELFAPELHILEEIEPQLLSRERGGQSSEEAIFDETNCGCTDLVIDLRERLLGALQGLSSADLHGSTPHHEADLVLLADSVTPSMVAFLPRQVVAIVAALDAPLGARRDVGRNSHAALLARGRGLPLAYVPRERLGSIPTGAWLVVDAAEEDAQIDVDPGAGALEAAQHRLAAEQRNRQRAARLSLDHLGIALRVNVASAHDEIPAAAEGIGLVRTEMTFSGSLVAPSEDEQFAAIMRVAAKARGAPIVVRLFDAGGDKPIAWLGGDTGSSRGIARLLAHPEVLATQLRALGRARERADIRVLLPFVESAEQVSAVRLHATSALPLGAMIESPAGVEAIATVAEAADFISIGTNDLTAEALGLDRTASMPLLDPRVLALTRRAIEGAHSAGRRVTICGEMAGEERGARIAVGLGADAISVAPARAAVVRASLARSTLEVCRAEARANVLAE